MEEELKEVWTTQIRPGKDYGYTDKSKKALRNVTEVYNDLSEYKPKYISAGVMGWNSKTRTYPQLKPIKVRRQDGGFDFYMVPEFAAKGIYVDKPKQVVEPIADLATQNNQAAIQTQQVHNNVPPKPNTVAKQPVKKSVAPKSNPIVKQPVPQNLLPYIANVSSDGVAFFNVPEGYDSYQFREAIEAVYQQNKELAQKPMVYYEQPQQQIQQQKQQQQAAQQSQKQYQAQRRQISQRQNMKNNTNNNAQADKEQGENNNNPDLVTEVFAYPGRKVDVYNIHPEAYQKVLEYLNQNYQKTETNNKPERYVLSLSGFEKVPIGGEVNDSTFHYIGKNGDDRMMPIPYHRNPNIINKNELFSQGNIYQNINTDNGKLKMYSRSNGNDLYYKGINAGLQRHPYHWMAYNKLNNNVNSIINDQYYPLKKNGLTDQQIIDYANKYTTLYTDYDNYDVDKSIFHPIEKEQTVQNNSTGNIVQKAKQKAKQAGKKVLRFLGFQNGGTLNYLNYIN